MTALFTSHIFYVLTSIIKYEAGDTGRFCYGEMLIERRLMESVAECGRVWQLYSGGLEECDSWWGERPGQARPGMHQHCDTWPCPISLSTN